MKPDHVFVGTKFMKLAALRSSCHLTFARAGNFLSIFLALALLLAGCQSNPYQWDSQTAQKVEGAMSDAAREAAAKAAGAGRREPGVAAADRWPPGRRHRQAVGATLRPVRQQCAGPPGVHGAGGGHAVQHGGACRGRRQRYAASQNATVPEAMEALRTVYGYDYKRDGNRIMVLGRGMQAASIR